MYVAVAASPPHKFYKTAFSFSIFTPRSDFSFVVAAAGFSPEVAVICHSLEPGNNGGSLRLRLDLVRLPRLRHCLLFLPRFQEEPPSRRCRFHAEDRLCQKLCIHQWRMQIRRRRRRRHHRRSRCCWFRSCSHSRQGTIGFYRFILNF